MMSVRVGVIGCGAIGQRRHIPEAARNPDVTLVALCDVLKDRVAEIAGKYKAQPFTDYKDMLKQADLDAVVVGTPNVFHAQQTIDALNSGKHVLVEKPMAGTREEARAMIKAAEKNGKFLMVGQNQRLMPPHVKAKEILDSGKLGKVFTFQTTFKHPGPDGWSVDGAKSWFFRKPEAILGVTGDLGVHKADLMRFLLGEEFSEVGGFVGTLDKKDPKGKPLAIDDNAVFTLKTAGGTIGTMTISWTNYGRFEDNGTTIYCEKGVIQIGSDPQFGVVVHHRDGNKEFHKLGAIASNTSQTTSGVMDMFIGGITTNKKPPIDGSEGYKSLNVILTAMEAAEQGKTLKISK
jgi:UDP-N-acetylglucosamine 3-dehydrogenase